MEPARAQLWTLNSGGTAVTSPGRVGIGTTDPQSQFHVSDPNSVTEILETAGGTNAWARLRMKTTDGFWDVGTSQNFIGDIFYIYRGGNPSIDFQLLPNGNFGLGATPGAKLHLYDAGSVSERIQSGGGTNAWTRIEFVNGDGQWNVGTSRNFIGDELYFARDGSPDIAFAVFPNGDTVAHGGFSAAAVVSGGDVTAQGNLSARTVTVRGGADLAEPFAIYERALTKGSVVVIDDKHPGRLKCSTSAYDTRVAGVVSGARGIRPGISLEQLGQQTGSQDVALSGRVYVQADANTAPIGPGDLLTTSDRRGYAMKVTDHARGSGAILGKAMSSLDRGTGLVLVLVTLQ